MGNKPRTFVDANILVRGVSLPRFPYEVLRHVATPRNATVPSVFPCLPSACLRRRRGGTGRRFLFSVFRF